MSGSAFATEFWMQADPWFAATDNWMEPNQWDTAQNGPPSASPGVPPLNTTHEIKVHAGTWTTPPTHVTIDSNVGIYGPGGSSSYGRITINANADIKGEANWGVVRTGSKNGLRVGSQGVGGIVTRGDVNQSAGTVTASNLYLGYGGTMTSDIGGEGYYVISGGSLTVTDNPQSGGLSTGGLQVASGVNQASTDTTKKMIGKLTVVGAAPVINVTSLTVGGNIVAGNPGASNTGTLEYQLGSGVSPINCSSLVLISQGPNTTANLVVSLTDEDVPPSVIVLVKNSSGNAVSGVFDTVAGDATPGTAALEGDAVVLSTPSGTKYYYRMSYLYNSEANGGLGNFGNGNDIALIPEPATIALFGLGLLALVRRLHRK